MMTPEKMCRFRSAEDGDVPREGDINHQHTQLLLGHDVLLLVELVSNVAHDSS